ncbi:MAG: YerC/YecD family TrpR-related protein [bacterium]
MISKKDDKKIKELIYAILAIKNRGEARKFLRDLLTEKELIEFGNRWKVARMLSKNVPYVEIEKETGLSSTTIARVSKWLNSGKNGYKLVLKRLNHHNLSSVGKGLR